MDLRNSLAYENQELIQYSMLILTMKPIWTQLRIIYLNLVTVSSLKLETFKLDR